MGVTEEAGKVAGGAIEALKSTPVVLALVIFNVLYMAGSFWSAKHEGDRWEQMLEKAFKLCYQTVPLPPPKPQ